MIENFNTYEEESNTQQKSANNVEEVISFPDLFTSEFMHQYTKFDSIEELLSSGGFEINSEEDYEAIPDEEIDAHVARTTKFHSWKEMLTSAVEETLNIEI